MTSSVDTGLAHTCPRNGVPDHIMDELIEKYLATPEGRRRLVETLVMAMRPERSTCPACEARWVRQVSRIVEDAWEDADPEELRAVRDVLARRTGAFGLVGTIRL